MLRIKLSFKFIIAYILLYLNNWIDLYFELTLVKNIQTKLLKFLQNTLVIRVKIMRHTKERAFTLYFSLILSFNVHTLKNNDQQQLNYISKQAAQIHDEK